MKEVLTKEECEEKGGHCWNYYKANDNIDEIGVINNSLGRKLTYYPKGEPQYRTCRHCKYTQGLRHAEWKGAENEK